jgi:hypothetical protein
MYFCVIFFFFKGLTIFTQYSCRSGRRNVSFSISTRANRMSQFTVRKVERAIMTHQEL